MAARRGALRAVGEFVHEELDDDAAHGGGGLALHARASGPRGGAWARTQLAAGGGTEAAAAQTATRAAGAKPEISASADEDRGPAFAPRVRRPSALARAAAGAAAAVAAFSGAGGAPPAPRHHAGSVPDTGKSGVLLEVQGRKSYTRYVDVRRKHLSYYKLKRTIGERVLRTKLASRQPEALEARVSWDRPVASLDLRLFRIQMHEHARVNHSFVVESAQGDGSIVFRASSHTEAQEWVDALKREQQVYLDEQRRRSTAMSLGVSPAEQDKPAMPILPTTYGGVDLVESFERRDMKDAISDLLGIRPARRKGFSILSFNILANYFVVTTNRPEMYDHCDRGCLNWQYRSKRIMRHLMTCGADIICLQEVERWVFDDELMRVLGARGYTGELECNKRKDGSEVPGTATFYKTALFEEAWRERSYRSLLLGLRFLTGPEKGSVLACANSHLEGNPLKSKDRASQMRGVFKKLERRKEDHRYVILCGDYNDGAQSALCQEILAEERFMSCYDNHPARDATCLLVPDDASSADIEALRVDHIFFDSRLRVRGIMNVMNEAWSREGMIELGLPSLAWPSDHLSIAAVLEFNPDSELFLVPEDAGDEPVDPFTVMTADEIFADENLNPLSIRERDEWLEHEANTFVDTVGRPSPVEIAKRKAASAAKEAFLTSLPEGHEAFLRKLTALRRKEAKANKKKNKSAMPGGGSGGASTTAGGPGPGGATQHRRSLSDRAAQSARRSLTGRISIFGANRERPRSQSQSSRKADLHRGDARYPGRAVRSGGQAPRGDPDILDDDDIEGDLEDAPDAEPDDFLELIGRPPVRGTVRRGSAHPMALAHLRADPRGLGREESDAERDDGDDKDESDDEEKVDAPW